MARHRQSITFVGRASRLAFNNDYASFRLTVKGRGDRPELVVECQARGQAVLEKFESLDEDGLVGVIGSLQRIQEEDVLPVVRLERLELLGRARASLEADRG